jgi:hypothetical protein
VGAALADDAADAGVGDQELLWNLGGHFIFDEHGRDQLLRQLAAKALPRDRYQPVGAPVWHLLGLLHVHVRLALTADVCQSGPVLADDGAGVRVGDQDVELAALWVFALGAQDLPYHLKRSLHGVLVASELERGSVR